MFPIELIGHFARILSLGMRLFGNIFGEHTATGIFMGLFPLVLPWPMMGSASSAPSCRRSSSSC